MMLHKMLPAALPAAKPWRWERSEESFVVKGFLNWKDASRAFVKHQSCNFHKSAAAAFASQVDITDMLSKQVAAEKQKNGQYLLVLSSQCLACQGLPL